MLYFFIATFLLLYIIFDIQYFVRLIYTVLLQKYFTKKVKTIEETTIYGFCTPRDLTVMTNHMNNAQYLRELDFARYHYLTATRLFDEIRKRKGDVLVVACNIRYRKSIFAFQFYKITTKVIWWDSKALYFEHRFITRDGFIRAIALSKMIITKVDVSEFMDSTRDINESDRKQMPEELKLWIDSIEISSQALKK